MSANRCEHGNVVSDTVGEYRCYKCQPVDADDLAAAHAANALLEDRVRELEGVVAELAEAAGLAWRPTGWGQ